MKGLPAGFSAVVQATDTTVEASCFGRALLRNTVDRLLTLWGNTDSARASGLWTIRWLCVYKRLLNSRRAPKIFYRRPFHPGYSPPLDHSAGGRKVRQPLTPTLRHSGGKLTFPCPRRRPEGCQALLKKFPSPRWQWMARDFRFTSMPHMILLLLLAPFVFSKLTEDGAGISRSGICLSSLS